MTPPAPSLWRLVGVLAAWCGGTAWQLQQASLQGRGWMVAALACAAGLAWAGWRRRGPAATMMVLAGAAAAGFALTELRAASRLHDRLATRWEAQTVWVTGRVAGLPRLSAIGTAFEFETEAAEHERQPITVPQRLSVGWYVGWDGDALLAQPPQALKAGQRWRLPLSMKRPHAPQNPWGYDLELSWFERGVGGTATVRPGAQRLADSPWHPIERLRQALRDDILLRVQDSRAAGVLAALAVGDQAAIERDDWDIFRVTGVAHLMSISGLHVTMFAWMAAAAVGALWRRWPAAMLRCPAPVAARWGGLLSAMGYALLAGWGVPAQRTVWMLAVVTVLQGLGRGWPWGPVWMTAGAVVAVIDPWALLQPGFWLSFVAVGLLMAAEPARAVTAVAGRPVWQRRLQSAVRSQAVATFGLAPLSLVLFHQVSVVGVLANLLAIPWVTAVVTPLALLGMLVPGAWKAGEWAVQAALDGLQAMAQWPLAVWSAAAAPGWASWAGVLGGAVLVMPLPWRLRLLGGSLLLPLLWPVVPRVPHGAVDILAADIGQGTAVLLRTRDHLLLYDAGPRYSPLSDASTRVLLPLLRARGEPRIDRLVLSHRDADHIGGATSLLAGVQVTDVLSSLDGDHALLRALPSHQRCVAGQRWEWDGVRFEVLHPRAEDYLRPLPPNARSCVLRVVDATGPRLLLTGDIEAAQEAELVARLPAGSLQAPVLLLPHHGSRTSSSPQLLQAVLPRVAIAQAAYRSRFGHPDPTVQQRLSASGIVLRRSDHCGAWHGLPTEAGLASAADPAVSHGICERDRRRRYWHFDAADRRDSP